MKEGTWIAATFVWPVLLPLMGLAIGKVMPLDQAKYGKKTSLWGQFRDGQLGWISIAWSVGMIYESKHFPGRADFLDMMEIAAYGLIALGTVISAAGAIEADPEDDTNWLFVVSSAVIAALAAFVFYSSHLFIEELNAQSAVEETSAQHQRWCAELQKSQPSVQCQGSP